MTWRRPEKASQWLLLFTPAAVAVISPWLGIVAEWLGLRLYLAVVAFGFYGLCAALLLCFALGVWLTRTNRSFAHRAADSIVIGVALAVVNAAIAFPGCLWLLG